MYSQGGDFDLVWVTLAQGLLLNSAEALPRTPTAL